MKKAMNPQPLDLFMLPLLSSDLELGLITTSLGGGHRYYAYWEIQVDSKFTWPPSKYTLYLYSIVFGVPYLYDSGSDLESI